MFKRDEIGVADLLQPCRRTAIGGRDDLCFAVRRYEAIAEAANGLDDVVAGERLEQLAQPPHVHIDRAAAGGDVFRPGAAQQLFAAEDAALVLEQEREQTKLGWRQRDLLAAHE